VQQVRMKTLSNETRISLARKIIILFFLCGIFLSFNLWTTDRVFPLLPVFGNTPLIGYPFDYVLAFALIAGLCIGFFKWPKWISLATLSILLILLLEDQNRLQAWVYIYLLCLLVLAVPQRSADGQSNILLYLRILIIGMYIWSGIHKLNPHFIVVTWTSILTDLFGITDEQSLKSLAMFGYCIPLIEIVFGFLLFFPKTRNTAVVLAATAHVFILVYLSPLGIDSNTVVYPWNFAMIGIVFVLFYGTTERFALVQYIRSNYRVSIVILFAWILPALNFAGLWDNYLSFAYYSCKTSTYYIVVSDAHADKLDKRLSEFFIHEKTVQGGKMINISQWSLRELNVPLYPEHRAYKKVTKMFCGYGIPEDQLYFLELKPPPGELIRSNCSGE